MTHKTLSSAHCNASDWNDVVNIMSAPSLTSNSWGISLRARYSLASLVFISSWISSLFWNEKLIGGGFFPPVFPLIYLWLMSEFVTDLLSAHFPRSCPCGLLKWIPAGDATAPPCSSSSSSACSFSVVRMRGSVGLFFSPPAALRLQRAAPVWTACALLTAACGFCMQKSARHASWWRLRSELKLHVYAQCIHTKEDEGHWKHPLPLNSELLLFSQNHANCLCIRQIYTTAY